VSSWSGLLRIQLCEEIEVFYGLFNAMGRQMNPMNLTQNHSQCVWKYKINIPKEKSISYEEFRAKASESLLEEFDSDCLNYSEDKDSERYFYEYCIYWESKLKAESKSSIITTRKPERAPNDIAVGKDSPTVEPIPSKEYYFRGDNKQETLEESNETTAIRFLEWYRLKRVFYQFHCYHIPNMRDKNWETTVFLGDNSYLNASQLFEIFRKENYE
jgi:hypothetical protein